MPQGIHDIEVPLPIRTVWEFVRVLDHWVVLVPGYISHEVINERRVTWSFTGDIGILKKEISLQVDITEWNEPTEVKFMLTGINENFTGEGYFKAQELGEKCTKMKLSRYYSQRFEGADGKFHPEIARSPVDNRTGGSGSQPDERTIAKTCLKTLDCQGFFLFFSRHLRD